MKTDVLQVCRNGHVVSDRLHSHPGSSRSCCERCGAGVLSSCPTCGQLLTVARALSLHETLGGVRPPDYCSLCGSAFPWAFESPEVAPVPPAADWTVYLRRLPAMIRAFRYRQTEKTPFRIEDARDFEDLLRGVLALFTDEMRAEARTPSYACRTCTDFFFPSERLIVIAKQATAERRERELQAELQLDTDFYVARADACRLLVLILDPEGLLREPRQLEAAWSRSSEQLELTCLIIS